MRRLEIKLLFFVLLIALSGRVNYAQTPTNSILIDEKTAQAAKQAFDEVRVSRQAIDALKAQVLALESTLKLERERSLLLEDIVKLRDEQQKAQTIIINSQEQEILLRGKREQELTARIAEMERKLEKANKQKKWWMLAGAIGGTLFGLRF